MAITWTNTTDTTIVLPNLTVVPAGLTVVETNEESYDDCSKHSLVKHMLDTGALKTARDSKAATPVSQPAYNGGPVPNSANRATQAPVAAAPAESPGPASNPPQPIYTDEMLDGMDDAALKALIKERTGQAVQGNPSRETLLGRVKALPAA